MSYGDYLRDVLRPLGVYDLEAPFQGGELDAVGCGLDGAEAALEEIQREMNLETARDWGLDRVAALFVHRPVAAGAEEMAAALAALLRIGGDSFTLAAINDTLRGCGIPARAAELGVGRVAVAFPGIPGIPDGFGEMRRILEEILPPHVGVRYDFWYLTWRELEGKYASWARLEAMGMDWEALEKDVY